jgi:hypothetical protein
MKGDPIMKKKRFSIYALLALLLVFFFSVQCSKDNEPAKKNNVKTWNTIFSDDFQRSDGPVGDNYEVQVECGGDGTAAILSNKLIFTGNGCWAVRYTDAVVGDTVRASIECEIKSGNPSFGLTLKNKNLGNNWQEKEFYAIFVNTLSWGIFKSEGGSLSPGTIESKAYEAKTNHVYKIQLVAKSKDLSAFIEDTYDGWKDSIKAAAYGDLLTGTIVGIDGYNSFPSDSLVFDNFKIERFK